MRGDAAAHEVARLDGCTAFLDRRPLFHGHTLVVPDAHHETLVDLPIACIEPLFSLAHYRRMGDGTLLPEVSEAFQHVAHAGGFASDELFEDLAHGDRLADREEVPEDVRAVFATAHEIAPEWHVRMQAAFQEHTDLAVSKTVNLPHDATEREVREVNTLAHRLGCKGVTVYRDGSRAVQVLAHAAPPSHRRTQNRADRG